MRTNWTEGRDYSVVCHTVWNVKCRNEEKRSHSLKHHPNYPDAKKLGDYEAAQNLADSLICPKALAILKDKIDLSRFDMDPLAKRPVLIAPSLTSGSNNVIPIWTAYNLGFQLGLGVDRDIFQKEKISRTNKSALFRLLNQPEFYGNVSKGREYIIVDDNYTLGGTIAALRSYIEMNGGKVICATVLADQDPDNKHSKNPLDKLCGHEIRWNISEQTLQSIEDKYGGWTFARDFQSKVGFSLEGLTEQEGRFVGHFQDKRALFRAVDEERNLESSRGGREIFATTSARAYQPA